MRKLRRNLYKCRLSHPGGGLVYCDKCGSITGKIEIMNYQYIKYMFVCKCENVGKVELYRTKKPLLTYPKRKLYGENGSFMCQNCETPIFLVKREAIYNFAFYVICKCGIEYDEKFENKRSDLNQELLETL